MLISATISQIKGCSDTSERTSKSELLSARKIVPCPFPAFIFQGHPLVDCTDPCSELVWPFFCKPCAQNPWFWKKILKTLSSYKSWVKKKQPGKTLLGLLCDFNSSKNFDQVFNLRANNAQGWNLSEGISFDFIYSKFIHKMLMFLEETGSIWNP